MFNQSRWAKNCTVTPLFYICCYGAFIIMKIDFQMLDNKEILGKRIIDVYLHEDTDGQELQIILEDGKQIEISFNATENIIMVQSD